MMRREVHSYRGAKRDMTCVRAAEKIMRGSWPLGLAREGPCWARQQLREKALLGLMAWACRPA